MPTPAIAETDDRTPEPRLANAIRALAMDSVQKANSGHPGMPMGMADVATVLFARHLRFDAADPYWPDRDRFVLSVGHGCMLLYGLLYLTGYEEMTLDEIKNFRQVGSKTPGHPEVYEAPGIETTTGPLGQGIGNAVGMAIAERVMAARFGDDVVDHRTYVMAGDGCLMEGISHEACSLAGHLRLGRLIMFYDDNSISIDGPTDLAFTDDSGKRFEAYGWHVQHVDGHDREAVHAAIEAAKADPRPSFIACKTTIGYGAPTKAGTKAAHSDALGEDEIKGARKFLGWPYPPFEIPDDVLQGWRAIGRQGAPLNAAWRERIDAAPGDARQAFENAANGRLPEGWRAALDEHIAELVEEKPEIATRKASAGVLNALSPVIPDLLGGSADLTGSNLTKADDQRSITPFDFSGRYVHYGVREHAMAAAMNGMASHAGVIPYGGTFLTFTDYARNAIRLAALSHLRVIHVATHDSIGLGEDGPTHQPVEHLASLRAMPNILTFRPADAVETAECWGVALERTDGPSVLCLSRQNLKAVRTLRAGESLAAKGGYVLREAEGGARRMTILATGSEVQQALEARDILQQEGVPTAVVSLPCFELFDAQPESYRAEVLGDAPRVAIEAAVPFGWARYVASEDDVIAMRSFGSSGKAPKVYEQFGITTEALVALAKTKL